MGILARLIGRPEFKGQCCSTRGPSRTWFIAAPHGWRLKIAENLRKLFQAMDPDVSQHDKEAS
jgi:hypothetical protein